MKLIKLFLAFLCLYTTSQATFALDSKEAYTLRLTIINHSKHTLSYTGVTGTRLGNTFTINATDILPGGTAIVTGMTSSLQDLVGTLHFRDSTGNGDLFKIVDNRESHMSQPIFTIDNDRFVSFIKSYTFNNNTDPHALSIMNAEIEIEDKFYG